MQEAFAVLKGERGMSHNGIHPSRFLWYSSLSFCAGVFFAGALNGTVATAILVACIGGIVTIFASSPRYLFLIICGMSMFVAGCWRLQSTLSSFDDTSLSGQTLVGHGRVMAVRQVEGGFQRFFVRMPSCATDRERCDLVTVSAFAPGWKFIERGSRVFLQCDAQAPSVDKNGFNEKMYLAIHGVRYVCGKSTIVSLTDGKNTSPFSVYTFRYRLEKNIDQFIPYPHATLAKGLLFGQTDGLTNSTQQHFARSSLSHIMAVSGYNISVLIGFFVWVGLWVGMWRKHAYALALVGVFVFLAMMDFQVSAVRAAIMGLVTVVGVIWGRKGDTLLSLAFASACMVAIWPLLLLWDVGFQLSVLATAGVLLAVSLAETFTWKHAITKFIFGTCLVSLFAQIFVAPVLLVVFHGVSLLGMVANLVALWAVPLAMMLSVTTAVLGFMGGFLPYFAGLGAYVLLDFELQVARFFSQIEYGYLETISSTALVVASLIVILVVLFTRWRIRPNCQCFGKKVIL